MTHTKYITPEVKKHLLRILTGELSISTTSEEKEDGTATLNDKIAFFKAESRDKNKAKKLADIFRSDAYAKQLAFLMMKQAIEEAVLSHIPIGIEVPED